MIKHQRFLKRCLDLALCQQPISCVSSLLCLVLFYVSDGMVHVWKQLPLVKELSCETAAFPYCWVQPAVTLECKFQKCTSGNIQTPWPAINTALQASTEAINSMNRSFSWGLLLRPNPLHRLLWYLPGLWCSPELLWALPSLDGSPQAHHMLLLTNLRVYSHSGVFPVSHLELGPFVWSLARTWGLSTFWILTW